MTVTNISAVHIRCISLLIIITITPGSPLTAQTRARARDLGVAPGIFQPGANNAITDVQGVKVGHATIVKGDSIRTGVTAI
ncbi:MAG TPA: P1 family peptidase, partial [Gemmatimonadaceae bacterium]|nr:P1 family peptidase [Gemmatimonadaceae bacterium]